MFRCFIVFHLSATDKLYPCYLILVRKAAQMDHLTDRHFPTLVTHRQWGIWRQHENILHFHIKLVTRHLEAIKCIQLTPKLLCLLSPNFCHQTTFVDNLRVSVTFWVLSIWKLDQVPGFSILTSLLCAPDKVTLPLRVSVSESVKLGLNAVYFFLLTVFKWFCACQVPHTMEALLVFLWS